MKRLYRQNVYFGFWWRWECIQSLCHKDCWKIWNMFKNTVVQSKHRKNKAIVQTRYIHCAEQRVWNSLTHEKAIFRCWWHEVLTMVEGRFVACFFSFGTTRSDGGLSPYPSLDTQHSLPGTQRSLEVKYASQYCVSLASTHTPGHAMFPVKLYR